MITLLKMMYMTEVDEVVYTETPEFPFVSFLEGLWFWRLDDSIDSCLILSFHNHWSPKWEELLV